MSLVTLGRRLPQRRKPKDCAPDWRQADPAWIKAALGRALSKPTGGWVVLDGSRAVGRSPRRYRVDGRWLVAWRDGPSLRVAPDACPHMGASLAEGCVSSGRIVCPWHGLALGADAPHGGWRTLPAHDDGVLAWVQLGGGENLRAAPILAPRPARYLDAVVSRVAACEPEDVIANRLDPWHGVYFHPHSFARLEVLEKDDESVTVRVVYRLAGALGIEVDARFHCPDAQTIVMTIVDGEGLGSVVETHARGISPGRTAIIEATLATSERWGFGVARAGGRWLRPLIRRAADRLWAEDAAYAERRYAVRTGQL